MLHGQVGELRIVVGLVLPAECVFQELGVGLGGRGFHCAGEALALEQDLRVVLC